MVAGVTTVIDSASEEHAFGRVPILGVSSLDLGRSPKGGAASFVRRLPFRAGRYGVKGAERRRGLQSRSVRVVDVHPAFGFEGSALRPHRGYGTPRAAP